MKLSEKILKLRKQSGMSQEMLAENLNVSRQTISRWESGSAQPDASNLLQLSKLFSVTADYLINEDYEDDNDVPAVKNKETEAKKKISKVWGICMALFGLAGNFVIYILSRCISVMIPHITYDDTGEKLYTWSGDLKGYSYKYFIQEFNLEFLIVLFWVFVVIGVYVAYANKQKVKVFVLKVAERVKAFALKVAERMKTENW